MANAQHGGWTTLSLQGLQSSTVAGWRTLAHRSALRMMDTRASPLLAARDVGRAASHGTLVFRHNTVCAMIATTRVRASDCHAAQLLHSSMQEFEDAEPEYYDSGK